MGILNVGRLLGGMNAGLYGTGSAAATLLGSSELNGLSIDFTALERQLLVRDSTSLMNYSGAAFRADNGKVDFSRASLATVTDSDGKIKWAPHNLLSASEQFDASNWTKYDADIAANSSIAPTGSSTADTITPKATNAFHAVGQGPSAVSGVNYTAAYFVKANGYNKVAIREGNFSGAYASFDLSTTSRLDQGSGGAGAITAIGGGWFMLTMVSAAAGSSMRPDLIVLDPTYTTGSVTGSWTANGTSGIYLWGAHLYRSDLGGMQANASPAPYQYYNSSTPKNLFGYSEAFSNAVWTRDASTVATTTATLAPNGTSSATKWTASASNTYHAIRQAFTYGSGPYVVSIYAKAAEYTKLYFSDLAGGNGYASYDLVAGTIIASGGTKFVSAAIEPAPNGFFRCSIVLNNVNAARSPTFAGYPTGATLDANGATFTGDGTSGIYIWGAMLSDSASLDAYVPNFGAAPSAAAYYGPRLDYDPVTLTAKGLLVEEQRTNLITQSDFRNGVTDASVRRGLLTASTFYGYLNNSSLAFGHDGTTTTYAYNGLTPSASTAYAFSAYVRMDDGNAPSFGNASANSSQNDFVIIIGGAIVTMTTATVTSVGNNIYRVVGAATTGASPIAGVGVLKYNTNSNRTFRVSGYQLEAATFPTSYIPTAASQVTRNADVASVGVSQFPYSSTESSIVVAFDLLGIGSGTPPMDILSLETGSTAQFEIYKTTNDTAIRFYMGSSNVSLGSISANTPVKVGVAGNGSSNAGVLNGGSANALSASLPAAASTLSIGVANGSNRMSGHIRQITYLPRRISNADLIARTA